MLQLFHKDPALLTLVAIQSYMFVIIPAIAALLAYVMEETPASTAYLLKHYWLKDMAHLQDYDALFAWSPLVDWIQFTGVFYMTSFVYCSAVQIWVIFKFVVRAMR